MAVSDYDRRNHTFYCTFHLSQAATLMNKKENYNKEQVATKRKQPKVQIPKRVCVRVYIKKKYIYTYISTSTGISSFDFATETSAIVREKVQFL